MHIFKKHLEFLNLQSDHLNGQVFIKFGYHTFINLLIDTEMIPLEFKEQDLCLKDC
jgi:hypothetical protein